MNKNLKDGFTLIEVSILFIIFITVAILIIPLSVDDVVLSKNVDKWKQAQIGFSSIPISMMNCDNYKADKPLNIQDFMSALIKVYPLKKVVSYKIKYLNGDTPDGDYIFPEMYMTNGGATIAFNWLNQDSSKNDDVVLAKIMFDVNGKSSPNVWGKDVFGFDVYKDKILPFGSNMDDMTLEVDCSRQGTGIACSYNYLKGIDK